MCSDVCGVKLNCGINPQRRFPILSELQLFSARHQLANQLVSFPALSLQSLTGCLSSEFTATLFAFPPFKVVMTFSFIPDVAAFDPIQRNEFPSTLRQTNLLDDPYL